MSFSGSSQEILNPISKWEQPCRPNFSTTWAGRRVCPCGSRSVIVMDGGAASLWDPRGCVLRRAPERRQLACKRGTLRMIFVFRNLGISTYESVTLEGSFSAVPKRLFAGRISRFWVFLLVRNIWFWTSGQLISLKADYHILLRLFRVKKNRSRSCRQVLHRVCLWSTSSD